jgi:imidazolonepropionase-like amidohydrolase
MLARILVLLFLGALPVHAQTTIIRAGHLVDPAKGTVADDQVILVEEGTIRAVGEEVSIPAGAVVVDLPNSWVLPGLMDAHTHLTLRLSHSQTLEDSYQRESTARRALRGIRNARILLEAGVTTVRDVGNAGNYADTDLRKAIEEGWFPGPTIINAGKIITPFGGQSERGSPQGRAAEPVLRRDRHQAGSGLEELPLYRGRAARRRRDGTSGRCGRGGARRE